MNLLQKQTNFPQPSGKFRTVLAKAIGFAIVSFEQGWEVLRRKRNNSMVLLSRNNNTVDPSRQESWSKSGT